MQKKFLTNIFLMLAVNLLIKPFWILGIDRVVQNMVGNEQYGVYANLFAISFIFGLVLDFGINNYNATTISKDKTLLNNLFSSIMGFKLMSAGVYVVLTIGAGYLYNLSQHELLLLFFLGVNQILSFFILYFRSNLSGLQLFKTDALLSVIDRLMMILIMGCLIWGARIAIKIDHFVFAQTAAYLVAAIISFWVQRPYLSKLSVSFSRAVLTDIFKRTYPYALLGLLMVLYTKVDVILIKKLVNDAENGIYASANRLLEAANMFAAMVASMLLALFAKNLAHKDELKTIVKTTMAIMIAPAIVGAAFCSMYKTEIMHLLYKNSTDYSAEVFGVVILCFIPMCITYIFGTLLTANGSLRLLNIIAFCTLIINIICNSFLIPAYGALGAGITAIISQTFFAIGSISYSGKVVGVGVGRAMIIRYTLYAACMVMIIYGSRYLDLGLPFSLLTAASSGILLMLAFKIINYHSVRALVLNIIRR